MITKNPNVTIRTTTTDKYFAFSAKFHDEVKLYVNIGGALIPCTGVNGYTEPIKAGEGFYGKIRFSRFGGIYLQDPENVSCYIPLGTHGPKVNVSKGQSEFQAIDSFLCKCKRAMYNDGLRAGTSIWDEKKAEAAKLFADLTGCKFHVSKDAAQWYR